MRWQPALRVAPPWHDDPVYIDALAASLRDGLAGLDFEPEAIVASFHGIPRDYFDKGDPYYCHCAKTTRLLQEKLGLGPDRLMMTFQSRFGRPKAEALYRRDHPRTRGKGQKEHRRHHAGLCRRLPRNHRGNRHREPRHLPRTWRREIRPHRLPQRQRGRHERDRSRRAPRTHGLGEPVSTGCSIVITTTNSQESAQKIIAAVMEKKLAACVQVFPSSAITSGRAKCRRTRSCASK